jgi:TolB-like protein
MKTTAFNSKKLIVLITLLFMRISVISQNKQKIAVISIDTKGMDASSDAITGLVHLELEKANVYEVMDRYDAADLLKANNIDPAVSFGKNSLVRIGKILNVDKMLTGSIEKFGNKLIVIFRLIDVKGDIIEKTDVMEYFDQQTDIQIMIRISINNLLGIQNDQKLLDLLVNYIQPLSSPKTKVSLNGPRMGMAYTFGPLGQRLMDPKDDGGYNMFPVMSVFGYQQEFQYISSGDFQALIELVGSVNGLESGQFAPSLMFMNGFRFNKHGWEIGAGPVFRATKLAWGYYDENGEWHKTNALGPEEQQYELVQAFDSRGTSYLSTGLIIAVGRTFHSGYLNIPVNLYYSPRKEGSVLGLSFGFNIAKTKRDK